VIDPEAAGQTVYAADVSTWSRAELLAAAAAAGHAVEQVIDVFILRGPALPTRPNVEDRLARAVRDEVLGQVIKILARDAIRLARFAVDDHGDPDLHGEKQDAA
jgi:hypothetical protein